MSFYFVFEYFSYINMYSDNENCLKVNIFIEMENLQRMVKRLLLLK